MRTIVLQQSLNNGSNSFSIIFQSEVTLNEFKTIESFVGPFPNINYRASVHGIEKGAGFGKQENVKWILQAIPLFEAIGFQIIDNREEK